MDLRLNKQSTIILKFLKVTTISATVVRKNSVGKE